MQLFSTIVFIDGVPVGYRVFRDEQNRFNLTPAESATREVEAPRLSAAQVDGKWEVAGTTNNRIIEQVVQDLEQNQSLIQRSIRVAP